MVREGLIEEATFEQELNGVKGGSCVDGYSRKAFLAESKLWGINMLDMFEKQQGSHSDWKRIWGILAGTLLLWKRKGPDNIGLCKPV